MAGKLGFFVISTHLGGAERSLLDFIVYLKHKGQADFKVVLPKATGPLVDELRRYHINYEVVHFPQLLLSLSRQKPWKTLLVALPASCQLLFYLSKLSLFLRRENFTTIHSTGLKFHLLLGFLSAFFNYHLILHLRDIISSPLLVRYLTDLSGRANVQLIANSRATAQAVAPAPAKIIYNGFDSTKFAPRRQGHLRQQLQVPESALLVGTVGAIARWKGQREFVHMALRLCDTYDQAYFLVVGSEIYDTHGDKGERARLIQLVKDQQLEKRILFLEFQEDVTTVYNSLDIFVHCSIAPEPFGRVVVEAMLCGVATVAANAGGPTEIIVHQQNGLLYEMGHQQQMREAVEQLLSDDEFRHKLQQEAPKISKDFSLTRYQSQLEKTLSVM